MPTLPGRAVAPSFSGSNTPAVRLVSAEVRLGSVQKNIQTGLYHYEVSQISRSSPTVGLMLKFVIVVVQKYEFIVFYLEGNIRLFLDTAGLISMFGLAPDLRQPQITTVLRS